MSSFRDRFSRHMRPFPSLVPSEISENVARLQPDPIEDDAPDVPEEIEPQGVEEVSATTSQAKAIFDAAQREMTPGSKIAAKFARCPRCEQTAYWHGPEVEGYVGHAFGETLAHSLVLKIEDGDGNWQTVADVVEVLQEIRTPGTRRRRAPHVTEDASGMDGATVQVVVQETPRKVVVAGVADISVPLRRLRKDIISKAFDVPESVLDQPSPMRTQANADKQEFLEEVGRIQTLITDQIFPGVCTPATRELVDEATSFIDQATSRPTRRHANAKGDHVPRRFDTTALHEDVHGKMISHADYIAHSEKWDYCWRDIKMGDRILDVGCGTDTPLMKAIIYNQAQATKVLTRNDGCYVGVDLNKIKPTGVDWATLIGEVDMTSEEGYSTALSAVPGNSVPGAAQVGYTLIVCLEVIEHMQVADGAKLLANFRDLLSPGGRIILSTPVFDGKAMARSHIHEYYIQELQELIESVGLRVTKRYGTFTAEPQLKRVLKASRPDLLNIYEEMRVFHSAGYCSGMFAPMFPDEARNNVWVVESAG
jgi:SAM-dependent methyltransferase